MHRSGPDENDVAILEIHLVRRTRTLDIVNSLVYIDLVGL